MITRAMLWAVFSLIAMALTLVSDPPIIKGIFLSIQCLCLMIELVYITFADSDRYCEIGDVHGPTIAAN